MWEEIHSKQKYVFTHQKNLVSANAEYIHSEDINNNLIDEYRLSIHPFVLGSGKPLFEYLVDRVNLIHIKTNTYQSGVVQLIYNKNK